MIYITSVVSCSYLVRLVLSLFAHIVIARSACLSIVRPCRRYQHRFIPRECRAWGVAAELEFGFAAGSKKDVCRTDGFHHRLDHFRSTRVPPWAPGPRAVHGAHWSTRGTMPVTLAPTASTVPWTCPSLRVVHLRNSGFGRRGVLWPGGKQ